MVTKILDRYPYIHTDWLLFGKGEMCNEDISCRPEAFLSHENAIIFTDSEDKPEYRKETEVQQPVYENKNADIEKVIYQEKPEKAISKIMVFYSDNTFDTFVAEKKTQNK